MQSKVRCMSNQISCVQTKIRCLKKPNRVCHSEPRDVLQSMVTPMEDMRHKLKSIVNQAKGVISHPEGTDDVMGHPKGNDDVIGYPEGGVDDPEYVGGTTPLSGLKTFRQITQHTHDQLKEAKIGSNEAK